ncbi:type I restriction endonuclease [Crocosphaera sp. XPORK-15E]|uniref:type I restriction endonuclease n=1 Tax=Crocosphaera sp. XPORK-15E TaxID=3110247 RepID=UPI002B209940|nr:type I restriction endonuclease [Crocosphaera sp. XPORK-15E]MEA5533431.1 type I restriction endonuclease [Crocosphaera sp. XPORK-15E]
MSTAITEAITTLAEAEKRFNLHRVENEQFFEEWRINLPELTDTEKIALNDLRRRYIYQRSEGHLLEGTVTLLLASPLLMIAGFYDPPFKIKAEQSVQIRLKDEEEVLQGRIDVLVLHDQLWIIILESKKTTISVWSALPQTLAYLMANPQKEHPSYAMMSNGDEIIFVKLMQKDSTQYALSRVFALFTSNQELYQVLQILKKLANIL